MKNMRFLCILALFASFLWTEVYCGDHPDGISKVSREQDALGSYQFSYSVTNGEGEQFRKEGTDSLGRVIGSYGLKHNDGTHRVVDYVADQNGFRAAVRTNEPGMISAEAADASIIKTESLDSPLTVAATSDERRVFGKRLTDASKVDYTEPKESSDETVRESRQHSFDDYRPLNPVAYYPTDSRGSSLPLNPRTFAVPRSPRVLQQTPEEEPKPRNVYYPPIDPHSARRPVYYVPRYRDTDSNLFPTTTSRKPYVPPYGGFDDDLPEDRQPPVSITTVHGGLGSRRDLSTTAPTPIFGSGRRFPPLNRDFNIPRFPVRSDFPSNIPRQPGVGLPAYPQGIPPPQTFIPPSYDDGTRSPNIVLRAVPIPNGIQAVRVDPNTGRVYERLVYPLFLRHDGYPTYDRNILLHNDDVSDDNDGTRNDNSGYLDIPFSYRGGRNQPSESPYRYRRYNNGTINEKVLNQPTAKDLDWLHRQLSLVEGFERNRLDGPLSNSLPLKESNFEADEDRLPLRNNGPSSRIRSLADLEEFEFSNSEDAFSRNPRHSDGLAVEDSKESRTELNANPAHSKEIEKEGKE